MRQLQRANEMSLENSMDSERHLCALGDDSLHDYLNDSHAAFVAKYQDALVQYEDKIKRSEESDIF